MVLTVRIPPDLLSHIALRLLICFEPYFVEQERMVNAYLSMAPCMYLYITGYFKTISIIAHSSSTAQTKLLNHT